MKQEIVVIPDYTAEQYLNTSDPYEFLYQYKENKFMLKQLLQKMKTKAGAVGVKCFVALFDAYCQMQAKQQGVILENSTQFDGQELELFSGEYICDDLGVMIQDKYGFENVVCRHPIMPIERLVNIDSGEERLKIAYKKGRFWRSLIAEKSVLASSNSILQLAASGVLVTSENAKSLSKYLFEIEDLNYDTIPEQKSVSRLGWVGEHGFSPYVDELVFDGENNFKHIFNSVKSEGDRQKWLDIMLRVRAEKSPGRLFLASAFASVILEPCGLLPFFVHAWGGTETGKTVGLMIASSVWACPKMGEYITTFNSTLVGQEMTATFLNSLPMCVDELQIQSSAGIKDFDKIIYQLTEGVGRTRGAKSGGLQKINTWRNCIITNGEHPISNSNSGGGAVNRIIEFECAEKVYSDLVGICQVINSNYGFAGREFVEYLQSEGAVDRVNKLQKEFYRELLKSDSTDKQAASASAILTADYIATELIFKDGNNLTVEDMAKIMTKKDEVNVNARAYDYILELVARNPNKFKANDFGDYQGEAWGKIDGNHIYIIKSVFDREMQFAGFNSTAFLSWAKRQALLITSEGRRTIVSRVAGTPTNCVCILKERDFEPIDCDF
jgi:uncharacterized protein (DUF927 family)